jgi:fibro-slime domain-containing protein
MVAAALGSCRTRRRLSLIALSLLSAALPLTHAGCSDDAGRASLFDGGATGPSVGSPSGDGGNGGGREVLDLGGDGGVPEAAAPSDTLTVIVRDFKLYAQGDPNTNPDFENVPQTGPDGGRPYYGPWHDKDIVADILGTDFKPVYKRAGDGERTLTTHGRRFFDQWYRDVPDVNIRVEIPLKLTQNADGSYEYDSAKTGVPSPVNDGDRMFFPIDDGTPFATAFGNQNDAHNYCFTVELHTSFTYQGGEYFRFSGDDDVFVFIDRKLVINLGGIHGAEPASVNVDTLGLEIGKEYPLDFFSAERHKVASNIKFTTTLGLRPRIVK